jgi:hypothetical protein
MQTIIRDFGEKCGQFLGRWRQLQIASKIDISQFRLKIIDGKGDPPEVEI